MGKSKKAVILIALLLLTAVAIAGIFLGFRVLPTVNHAQRISELLEPILASENKMFHISAGAEAGPQSIALDCDVFIVTEPESVFTVLEQEGITLYMTDQMLLLENGKAFRIDGELRVQMTSYWELLPQIGALYDVLKISAQETENSAIYDVTVTGEQVNTLLAAASLGDALPADSIQNLKLSLTEENGRLERIQFSGAGKLDGTEVVLDVTISGFRILAEGDYPIPDQVKQTVATVDPNELLSITEDLYRLVVALAPMLDGEYTDGTLAVRVDCGLIQLDTDFKLSDLTTTASSSLDPVQLQKLPELISLLFMEGDFSCTEQGSDCVYTLVLGSSTIQQFSKMIMPDLAQYAKSLTEGTVEIHLDDHAVTGIEISIEGKIDAMIIQVPITVVAEFSFE